LSLDAKADTIAKTKFEFGNVVLQMLFVALVIRCRPCPALRCQRSSRQRWLPVHRVRHIRSRPNHGWRFYTWL